MKRVSLACFALAFGCPANDTMNDVEEQLDAEVHEDAGENVDAVVAQDAAGEADASSEDGGALDAGADAEVLCDGDSTSAACIDYPDLRAQLLTSIVEAECAPGACPMVTVVAQGAEARCDSVGKRILLIDEAIVVPAATRYRQRTLDALLQLLEVEFKVQNLPRLFRSDRAAFRASLGLEVRL